MVGPLERTGKCLLPVCRHEDDGTVGFGAPFPGYPGNPVRATRFGMNLVRAGG